MRRLLVLSTLLAASVLLLAGPRAWAMDDEANRPVASLESALKVMLQMEASKGFKERYLAIYRTVASTHDFEVMARARVGARWEALTDDDRKELKNLLFKRVVSDYVVRLDGQDALGLTRGLASDLEGGGAIAALSEEGRVVVAFRLDEKDGAWRITDVRWEGRDTAAAERRESDALLAASDARALVEVWKAKVPVPRAEGGPSAEATPSDGETPPAAARSPREIVDDLQTRIIDVMKQASSLGFEGRYERFAPLIDATHHLPAIAQATILRPWSQLTKEQREAFVRKFREFSIARYAARFDGYSGERFVTGAESTSGPLRTVRSELVKSDGEHIQFDWVFREIGGRWWILNIVVDGVSDLATKKEEYRAIFAREGFPGLMRTLEDQIRTQRAGS